ncbi:MAG: lipoyl(octanoyl) transferase LipB, partial [Candidatus Bathyarchaeota archaeon]
LNLEENRIGVREYIWKLEAVIIELLLSLGIQGHRVAKYPGVWSNGEKLCSIGIHVSHHITMHGFALNIDTDLRHFEYINPCGIKGKVMTSISKLLGYPVEVAAIMISKFIWYCGYCRVAVSSSGRISSLNHKTINYSVENCAVIHFLLD